MIRFPFYLRFFCFITLTGLFSICPSEAKTKIPTFQETRDRLKPSELKIFDRSGDLIHEQRKDFKVRALEWTSLSEISPALKNAVLLSEDKRFFEHHGVDWLAIAGATGKYLLGISQRGASTLSMQLAAILDQKLKPMRFKRGFKQKINQVFEAVELERSWSKEQVLEAYLNLISFRGELQGVASAAHGLFGKAPSGLNQEESLILAALIRSPQADEKKVAERACWLAQQSEASNTGLCDRIHHLVKTQGLSPRPFPPDIALAPHAARILFKLKREHSTLDRKIQTKVLQILRQQVIAFHERNMKDAAALVVENKTGQVVAYVGSVGELSNAGEVDGVRAKRQAGSTLKPFLYELAIEKRYLTARSLMDDSNANFSLGPGSIYRPMDFDHEYHGNDITLRMALASSLNIPAVRTLQLIGVGSLVNRLKSLGFQDLQSEEHYGPSLALGTADVSLWELVNAYRTLANQGHWSELSLSLPASPSQFRRIFPEDSAFVINDILSDPSSRKLTFGLDSPLALRFWTAVKTGTSKDMRDNWCIGFSSRYTVGVWTGNFSGEPMRNVTGVTGAAPAWAEIMESLHEVGKDLSPQPSKGLIQAQNEWYLLGTEPRPLFKEMEKKPLHQVRINYPVNGLMIARDPDIPIEHQRVFFEASSRDSSLQWVLNDNPLSHAGIVYPWQPEQPGNYHLKLISSSGDILDEVRFSVKR